MKKFLYIIPILLGAILTSCYDGDIEEINNRLDAIENNQIASINSQISSITNSINSLIKTDAELKNYITALEKETEQLDDIKATIELLKAKDKTIENLIAELNEYINNELGATEDWVTATFATLVQYNKLADEISSLKTYVEGMNNSLSKAIDNVEASMKDWVNEQLTGYYTIAEIDAKIEALNKAYIESDKEIKEDVATLQEELTTAKSELTKSYQDAIANAINNNNGVIDAKIANEIEAVNETIAGLEKRLDDIESRLSAVEEAINKIKALDITFDTTEEIACMPGASVLVSYTITGGDDETAIEAWGDGGWSATVIHSNSTSGSIKITAPTDATSGKVVVLATSGAGGVKMKTLLFTEGVLTNINDTYKVDWEACSLQIKLQTNLNYYVNIPATAKSWITLEETRATLRSETLTFNIAENSEEMSRSAVIELIGECGDILQSFEIEQKPRLYINFADKYAKAICVEKFDTNNDGEISFEEASKVSSIECHFFGDYAATISSFDELQYFSNLISIEAKAFYECSNLASITFPNSLTSIGEYAFYKCTSLVNIVLPEYIAELKDAAFIGCSRLFNITIPESVVTIGEHVFSNCSNLTSITIPNSVTAIKYAAFFNCQSLTNVIMSNNITTIGNSAFYGCSNLTNIILPEKITNIGEAAFYNCTSLTNITIPKSIVSIGSSAFVGCTSLAAFYGELASADNKCIIIDSTLKAFAPANITNYTIPNDVKAIAEAAFARCSNLSNITIPDSVVSIGARAFEMCSGITFIKIPKSVSKIEEATFWGMKSLSSITIPEQIVEIKNFAFSECPNLEKVYCKCLTPPHSGYGMFYPHEANIKIFVPSNAIDIYKTADGWKELANKIEGYDFE